MTKHTLTTDQEQALDDIFAFLADDVQKKFILSGFSGCGKSTLVQELIERWPDYCRTLKLLDPKYFAPELVLTATTNKAAENLADITKEDVVTIYSHLSLVPATDYTTNKKILKRRSRGELTNQVILIDEASYLNQELLDFLAGAAPTCKIIFVGDEFQLLNIGDDEAVVWTKGFPEAKLTKVVRQTSTGAKLNPITELSTYFKEAVETGDFPEDYQPDGQSVMHVDRDTFNDMVLAEFTDPKWTYRRSKVLAYTNRKAVQYNNFIRGSIKGTTDIQDGDYAVCNEYFAGEKIQIKTDELVHIEAVISRQEHLDVPGTWVKVKGVSLFLPDNFSDKKKAIAKLHAAKNYSGMHRVETTWVDLRSVYAQTVNKSQGSTYDRVFIDVDDIGLCKDMNQLYRMLYVAVSRAKKQVILTGDI